MGLWEEWNVRKAPPRVGQVRVVAVSNASANVELDNDLFQDKNPGDVGPCLMTLQPEANDVYVLFGSDNTVAANSAATSGNTRCIYLPVLNGGNPDEGYRIEVNPFVDRWMAFVCKNGAAVTATLRYYLSSYPKQARIGVTGA